MIVDPRLSLVSPHWYKKIRKAFKLSQLLSKTKADIGSGYYQTLDVSQAGCCMIGESHDFDAKYYNFEREKKDKKKLKYIVPSGCIGCTRYSSDIYQIIKNGKPHLQFRKCITNYLNHLEFEHRMVLKV